MGILWENLGKALQSNKDSLIEEYGGLSGTYLDLYNEIEDMARRMSSCKLAGLKCAVLCDKSRETLKMLLFCWKMDMIAIPISFHYGEDNICGIIESTKPDFILSDRDKIGFVEIPVVRWEDLPLKVLNGEKDDQLECIEVLMCTSGTTGKPKASMLTGSALIMNAHKILDYFPLSMSDRILIGRPLYHCAVLIGEVIVALLQGTNIVFYSEKFNPIMISKILNKREISVMCGTPTLLKTIADYFLHLKKACSLKTIALSGELLLSEYIQTMKKAFIEAKIFNVYGLTEAGPRVSYLDSRLIEKKAGSVGKALKNVDIKIIGDSGENKPFEVGRVFVNTPTVMKGYYNNAIETEKKIKGLWLETGDLGYLDKEGYLYISGRSDDMIIKSGINVYPQEIENKFLELPEVEDVMVYGELVNDIEQICADVVVDNKYKQCDTQNIMNHISDILPSHLIPYRLRVVEQLPRNGSGKKIRPRIKRDIRI